MLISFLLFFVIVAANYILRSQFEHRYPGYNSEYLMASQLLKPFLLFCLGSTFFTVYDAYIANGLPDPVPIDKFFERYPASPAAVVGFPIVAYLSCLILFKLCKGNFNKKTDIQKLKMQSYISCGFIGFYLLGWLATGKEAIFGVIMMASVFVFFEYKFVEALEKLESNSNELKPNETPESQGLNKGSNKLLYIVSAVALVICVVIFVITQVNSKKTETPTYSYGSEYESSPSGGSDYESSPSRERDYESSPSGESDYESLPSGESDYESSPEY